MVLSPLHVEGRFVKDELDNIVVLFGIETYMWWLRDRGPSTPGEGNLTYHLDNLKNNWLCKILSCHFTVIDWYNNVGNMQFDYKRLIDMVTARDMYLVIDGAGPEIRQPTPTFDWNLFNTAWREFARQYASYTNILFNPVNEPYDDGIGTLTAQAYRDRMEATVDAIRAEKPDALIVIDGLEQNTSPYRYLTSLAFLTDGYNIRRPNILYHTHIYGYSGSGDFFGTSGRGIYIDWALNNGFAVAIGEANVNKPYWFQVTDGVQTWWTVSDENAQWYDALLKQCETRRLGVISHKYRHGDEITLVKNNNCDPNIIGDIVIVYHQRQVIPPEVNITIDSSPKGIPFTVR